MTLFNALIDYPDCKKLILHSVSGMGAFLQKVSHNPNLAKGVTVWLYLEEEVVMAWAWVFQRDMHKETRQLSFFVYSDYRVRRKGVGERLFLKANEFARHKHRRMFVYPWSDASDSFYDKLKVPKRNQKPWISS